MAPSISRIMHKLMPWALARSWNRRLRATYLTGYPDLDVNGYGQDLITFFERACAVKRSRARRR